MNLIRRLVSIIKYLRVGLWPDIGSGGKLTCLSREPHWPELAAQVCISQCLPCCFLLPEIIFFFANIANCDLKTSMQNFKI